MLDSFSSSIGDYAASNWSITAGVAFGGSAKKTTKKWKRECEDLDMLWLQSRKEFMFLESLRALSGS